MSESLVEKIKANFPVSEGKVLRGHEGDDEVSPGAAQAPGAHYGCFQSTFRKWGKSKYFHKYKNCLQNNYLKYSVKLGGNRGFHFKLVTMVLMVYRKTAHSLFSLPRHARAFYSSCFPLALTHPIL